MGCPGWGQLSRTVSAMAQRKDSSPDDAGSGAGPDTSGGVPKKPGRGKRPIWLAALAAVVTGLAVFGIYTRENSGTPDLDSPTSPGGLFQAAQAAGTSLTGVGRTIGLSEPCTAWLLDVGGPAASQAYAITNGRCVGATDPAAVVSDQSLGNAVVEFNAFAALTSAVLPDLVQAPVSEVVWASTRGTDLAVLRLASTYGEMADQGVRAIEAVPTLDQGAEILIAGVPVEDIAEDEQFLRGSRCTVGGTTDVRENGWLWRDEQASDCHGILDGSGGSPVFNPAGNAVAMVNTSTIGAETGAACSDGQPCEVTDGGVAVKPDTSYMVAVDALAQCFPEAEFALGGACILEDPSTVVPAVASAQVAKPGTTVEVRMDGPVPEGVDVRVKEGPLGETDCLDPEGWQDAAKDTGPGSQGAGWVHSVTLPAKDGYTLVCVGGPGQPTEIVIQADGTAPDPATIELTQTKVDGGVQVRPVAAPPELVDFRWVRGPAGSMECAVAEGYVQYAGTAATIPVADLPSAVCVIGIDQAGNESPPARIEVS